VLIVTRYDPDVRQANVPPGTGLDRRRFHNYDSSTGTVTDAGTTRIFDYPQNGVVFAEGSIRIRGRSGAAGFSPQPLTIVSGGTIYIEGNILQERGGGTSIGQVSGWHVSLLAQDNVVLNPTAFTRITPGPGVDEPAGDPDDLNASGFYRLKSGYELDFSFAPASIGSGNYLMHLKHAGGMRTDPVAETHVTLNLPSLAAGWPSAADAYAWGNNPPPVPPAFAPSTNPSEYIFHEISPGKSPWEWGETSWRYPDREQKTFFMNGLGARLQAGVDNTFRFQNNVNIASNQQDYLLGKLAVLPDNGPLPIRIEATMYAYTGSWFVIPPPFFNDHLDNQKQGDPYDSRAYMSSVTNPANGAEIREDPQTFPYNMDVYPFYREPLNVEIEILGSITENMPAEPNERAKWVGQTWMQSGTYDPTAFPYTAPPPFRPNIRYRYDGDLRRLVRVRNVRTGREVVGWAGPPSARATGFLPVQTLINQVLASNAYAVTLPLAPRLPASEVFYEGNPL
jgi:hypothetical protein